MMPDPYADACERAEADTFAKRKAYAAALQADTERLTDALYQRLSVMSPAADSLCKTVAHLLVTGTDPSGLLACIAMEEADDAIGDIDPELYMTDNEDNDE